MTPQHAHTFRLWLALSQHALAPALREHAHAVLMPDVASDLTEVTAEWNGQSLLLAALPTRVPSVAEQPTDLTAQPHETLPLALIARGVNPWQRLHSPVQLDEHQAFLDTFYTHTAAQGYGPLFMALRTQSWATLRACLAHPQRPDWATVMTHQWAGFSLLDVGPRLGQAQAVVAAGLPINWQDAAGNTLLHHAQSSAVVTWLVQQGADPHRVNAAGHTPLQALERQGALSPDTRSALVAAMGHETVSPREVWQRALTGKGTEVFPYFPGGQKGGQAMAQWRWDTPQGPVNLLDAAALAAARRPSSEGSTLKPEFTLINRLLALPTEWPEASRALARLVLQHQSQENLKRWRGAAEHLMPQADPTVLLGVQRYAFLAQAATVPSTSENFGAWWSTVRIPSVRQAILDVWLTWAQARPTKHWARSGSLAHSFRTWKDDRVTWQFPEGATPAHRVALLGETLVMCLTMANNRQGSYSKELLARQAQRDRTLIPPLVAALREAGATLHDPQWENLRRALQTTGAAMEGEITALLRHEHTLDQPAPERVRRRLRS